MRIAAKCPPEDLVDPPDTWDAPCARAASLTARCAEAATDIFELGAPPGRFYGEPSDSPQVQSACGSPIPYGRGRSTTRQMRSKSANSRIES